MNENKTLILTQYRDGGKYRNFLGHLYHFPKSYLNNFNKLPIDFVFYEPVKSGKGEFFGFGEIVEIIPDNESDDHYFAVIKKYQEFKNPVKHRDESGKLIESNNPHYNPQNAVRFIPKKLFDEICLEGGITLNFKSDAHLIKVLGEQLIGSEKVGILELIKNAIDAQATYCKVRIEKIKSLKEPITEKYEFPDLPGPVIVIEDDGIGMTKEVIENGWLRPASTIKTNIKEKIKKEREIAKKTGNLGQFDAIIKQLKKEHGNRIPLGEKGVGRFATHRLGKFLEIRTKVKENPYELVLKIDWDRFDIVSDDFIDLDSIGVNLFKQQPSKDFGKKGSGTMIIIYGGREGFEWNEEDILDLNRAILNLNSPNPPIQKKNKKDNKYQPFNAYLECPQIEDLPKHLIYEESTPNFTLDVLVSEQGIVEYSELKFKHPFDKLPPETWIDENYDLRIIDTKKPNFWKNGNTKREPKCGAFYLHIDTWYRKKEWIDIPNYQELIDYLDEFGGVSIYRDNILMFDAKLGSEVDWLGLAQKHIKQGFRVSYRDMIGNVEIEQVENFDLTDKTNREGLIENQAFKDLSVLTSNIIEHILLPRYIAKRDEYKKLTKGIITNPKKLAEITKTNAKFISNVANSNYPFDSDPYTFFDGLWETVEKRKEGLINLEGSVKELKKSIEMLEKVQNKFVEQAGFGISVSVSLHEINKITTNFYHSILQLIKSGNIDKFDLEQLKDTSASLKTELKRLGPLRTIRNERSVEFDILRSIKYASEIFKRRMKEKQIEFIIENPEEKFNIFGRYSALNQVLGNLFDNSLYWIENSDHKEKSKIKIKLNKQYRTLIFADSGLGISDIIRPYLFEPGYSLKIPPSGLGLYICKTYLNSMKARIYETPKKDRLPDMVGAQFTIDFSRTPKNRDEK